jgi:hypothetical protein
MENSMRTVVVAVLTAIGCTVVSGSRSVSAQSSGTEPWQSSWDRFVETHNKCVAEGCLRQFVGKEVTWEARIGNVDAAKQTVSLEMTGPAVKDKLGLTPDSLGFALKPTVAQWPKWAGLTKGTRVKFKTQLAADLDMFGNLISFLSLGPGKALAAVRTTGGELLEILQHPLSILVPA